MASCRNFVTVWMKFDHSVVLIPKGSWFFKCFLLGLSLLATQLRIAAGGPNPVLLTTKLHVCEKWRVSYSQAKEWISMWISSFYWLCLQEMQCSPCILLAANASVNPDIRSSSYFPAHSLKAPKKPARAMLILFSPQKPRTRLQRALQTCCAGGHHHEMCKRELFNGHFVAIRGHKNI